MSNPNTRKIFIGGAGKSGTTFLFSCLGQHPEIVPAQPKEPFFFLDQDHPLLNTKNNVHQEGNHDFFFPKNQGIHLDATVHLLYQKEIPAVFSKMKNSKVIFILRHPSERIYSSFQFVKHNLAHFKKEVNFSEYVEALLEGKNTLIQSWLRTKGSQYVLAKELEISTYYQHIQRWEKVVGKGRLYLLTFKELIEQPEEQLSDIINWLALEQYDFALETENDQNTSYKVKSSWIHYQVSQLAKFLPKSKLYESLKQLYFNSSQTTGKTQKSESDIKAIQKLNQYFKPHNQELENLTELDIKDWIV